MSNIIEVLKLPSIRPLLVLTILILVAGTIVFHWLEDWDYIDSFYFSVITLTTIGYGDLHPTSPVSKIVVVFFVFAGLGIILGFINAITERQTREMVDVEKRGVDYWD